MKKYIVYGDFKCGNEYYATHREIEAENTAKAIEQYNSYNKKILGAEISEAVRVFELVWKQM